MSKDVPIASLLRVVRGVAAPEELAAIAVVVACYAHRTSGGRDEAGGAGPGRRRTALPATGCWAGCWACR
ncbi:acyl-CoA carboxylase epsilon subunit [Streptomyces sp. NPDC048257]|uniref:acyl-CoA carboxylase epsilon subunit n=1 Tax=Streptomyces sp. NPDC048257 TaxID=3365526 RepID=UPI003715FFFF